MGWKTDQEKIPEIIFFKTQNLPLEKPKVGLVDGKGNANYKKNKNIFGDIMWPIIFMLKVVGTSPLSYSDVNIQPPKENNVNNYYPEKSQETIRRYSVRYKSFFLLWTVTYALNTILHWATFGLDNIIGVWNPAGSFQQNGDNLFKVLVGDEFYAKPYTWVIVTRFILIIIPGIQIAEIYFAWKESFLMVPFLKNWELIQADLEHASPHLLSYSKTKLHKSAERKRNLFLFFYVAIPTLLVCSLAIIMVNISPLVRRIFAALSYAINLTTGSLLEDVKVILTYWNISAAYTGLHEGIIHTVKEGTENLTRRKIHDWQKLLQSLRQQVDLACIWQKNHQLLFIGGSILLITCCVFVLLTIPLTTQQTQTLAIMWISMTILTTGRLYLRIIAANSITLNEGQILHEMIRLNTKVDNDVVRSEIKFLHDIISQKPSIISFGSYVTLDKRLLLGVASQVVTYIIVLLQFRQGL